MSGPAIRSDRLDAAGIAQVLAARQAAVAQPPAADAQPRRAVLAWTLGDVRFGTPLEQIRAIVALPPVTPLPGAPAQLAGVVAWRGHVVNLFDPAAALGVPERPDGAVMLVLRGDVPRIALRITLAEGVARVDADGADGALLPDTPETRLTLVDADGLRKRLLGSSPLQQG